MMTIMTRMRFAPDLEVEVAPFTGEKLHPNDGLWQAEIVITDIDDFG
jgi:hypothetical protein